MLDHISLRVSNHARSLEFYKKALAPLGYTLLMEFPGVAGMGVAPKPDFWFTQIEGTIPANHVAFAAKDKAAVDAFYEAALAAGGRDFGKPGTRKEYHPGYYGAFVLDPDGHNIEAVIHNHHD